MKGVATARSMPLTNSVLFTADRNGLVTMLFKAEWKPKRPVVILPNIVNGLGKTGGNSGSGGATGLGSSEGCGGLGVGDWVGPDPILNIPPKFKENPSDPNSCLEIKSARRDGSRGRFNSNELTDDDPTLDAEGEPGGGAGPVEPLMPAAPFTESGRMEFSEPKPAWNEGKPGSFKLASTEFSMVAPIRDCLMGVPVLSFGSFEVKLPPRLTELDWEVDICPAANCAWREGRRGGVKSIEPVDVAANLDADGEPIGRTGPVEAVKSADPFTVSGRTKSVDLKSVWKEGKPGSLKTPCTSLSKVALITDCLPGTPVSSLGIWVMKLPPKLTEPELDDMSFPAANCAWREGRRGGFKSIDPAELAPNPTDGAEPRGGKGLPAAWKSEVTDNLSGRTKPEELKSEWSEGKPGTLKSPLAEFTNEASSTDCLTGAPALSFGIWVTKLPPMLTELDCNETVLPEANWAWIDGRRGGFNSIEPAENDPNPADEAEPKGGDGRPETNVIILIMAIFYQCS